MARHVRRLPRIVLPWLLVCGGELVAAGFVALSDAPRHLAALFLLYGAGSLLALAAARSLSASTPVFLILCGALFRATLLLRAPELSDDWKRYAWDARVAEAGISPYALAPADGRLAGIAPALRATVPHADVRTVYPPVAQGAFRLAAAFGPGPRPLQSLFALADLAIVALLLALGGPGAGFAAALYAFHPLPILESAGEGHVDALGVALLLIGLVLLRRARSLPALGGVAFALSVLTKYVSGFAAIPILRDAPRRLRFACSAAAAVGVAVGIAWSRGGVAPIGGLGDYATRWEFNALAYPALTRAYAAVALPVHAKALFELVKARLGHPAWAQSVYPYFSTGFLARATLAVALLVALVAIGRRVRETEAAVFASLAAVLLAGPTLQPWYLLWVLPFAARMRERAFLYLSFAVPLSYGLLYPAGWLPGWLVGTLEYGPFLALLLWTLRRRRLPAMDEGEGEAAA